MAHPPSAVGLLCTEQCGPLFTSRPILFLCPSDQPCRTLNQIPGLLTGCSVPSTYCNLACTMQVRCGTPIHPAQAHGPTTGTLRCPFQSIVWASHMGKSFLAHTTNHTETERGGGVSHDGKITNLQQRQQCLVFRSLSSCEQADSRKAFTINIKD